MLIKYKKPFEKIAMGLLSFTPEEKELKILKQTMQLYEENQERQLFLWKQDKDIAGLIGIEIKEQCFLVLHISVNPSFRGEGVGHAMVTRIQQLQEPLAMCATMETKNFLSDCWKKSHPFNSGLFQQKN